MGGISSLFGGGSKASKVEMPPPPAPPPAPASPPTLADPGVGASGAQAAARARAAAGLGLSGTVATGPQGVTDRPSTALKSLLGGVS